MSLRKSFFILFFVAHSVCANAATCQITKDDMYFCAMNKSKNRFKECCIERANCNTDKSGDNGLSDYSSQITSGMLADNWENQCPDSPNSGNVAIYDNTKTTDGSFSCGSDINIDYRCSSLPDTKYLISDRTPPNDQGAYCYCRLRHGDKKNRWVFVNSYWNTNKTLNPEGCSNSMASLFNGGNCEMACNSAVHIDNLRSLLVDQDQKRTVIPNDAPDNWYTNCGHRYNDGTSVGTMGSCGPGITIEHLCSTSESEPMTVPGKFGWCRLSADGNGPWKFISSYTDQNWCRQNAPVHCGNFLYESYNKLNPTALQMMLRQPQ